MAASRSRRGGSLSIAASSYPATTSMTRSPHKLLVVDDDPRLRDLLRRYLGDNGFAVHVGGYTGESGPVPMRI